MAFAFSTTRSQAAPLAPVLGEEIAFQEEWHEEGVCSSVWGWVCFNFLFAALNPVPYFRAFFPHSSCEPQDTEEI